MSGLEVVFIALASWRLASMLVREEGPFNIFSRWRDLVIGEGEVTGFGKMFSCMWCMTWWTSSIFYCIWEFFTPPVIIFAASAVAVLVEELLNASINSDQT